MAQKIKQIRYFGTGSQQNTNGITAESLINGENLIDDIPLCSLGVRALPGTKFYLNNNVEPIIISHLGIFEIDLKEGGAITSIKFDKDSVFRIDQVLSQGYIIIDMLEKGGN